MAKKATASGGPTSEPLADFPRDPETGRVMPKGYGALKGQYVVRDGIDLTKPIAEQVARLERLERARERAAAVRNRAAPSGK